MAKDKNMVTCFNSFYEFMRDEYRAEMAQRPIPIYIHEFDIDNFLTTLRQYYHGGRFDFLLNSKGNIDLLGKRFIVFEIDSIKDNKELFPVVTIIIMEAFINKMRRLKGIRKVLICEEAWKALSSANMAEYMKYLYKTVRKYFGEAVVVTQEVDDIISSPIVKETIINNSDCKILLDQRKYMNRFDQIQELLGLTDKEKAQILSINMANNPSRLYKEVWIGLGGTQSAVYATEVSTEEYLTYTTEETEKMEVLNLAEKLDGNIYARANVDAKKPVFVKVALSPTSIENAKLNLQTELPGWDFEEAVAQADQAWEKALAKVEMESSDAKAKTIFYTALYHTMVAPSEFCDVNGDYYGADHQMHKGEGYKSYTTMSCWDTYRSAHPLMSIIHPEMMKDMMWAFVNIYKQQGKLPVWHLMGCETDCMVGNPGVIIVADGLNKGYIEDTETAFEALKNSVTVSYTHLTLPTKA